MIINSDCVDGMRMFPNNYFDSVVTDPPYELGFMGKTWDASGIAYNVAMWREALRVLKPGGHMLAFSGSRTYHRMVCAIEDAGFEVRDQIMWIYGSGFPKSLDVSKAIDKHGGQSVAWFGPWLRKWRAENGVTQKEIAALFPSNTGGLTGCVANWELGFNMPTPDQFNAIRERFKLPFESLEVLAREVIGQNAGSRLAVAPGQDNDRGAVVLDVTRAATPAAQKWQGWGTALKPAHEPICVARKPLAEGTVAANVLEWGAGAVNIDACRVATTDSYSYPNGAGGNSFTVAGAVDGTRTAPTESNPLGRWPANLLHDGSEEVLAAFPDAGGQLATNGIRTQGGVYGKITNNGQTFEPRVELDKSAARFFYCAKASKSDRGAANIHPTVKPTDLMRYLCRLITPPGGTVLDPFAGSGSTGKAAVLERFSFVGFELSAEYAAIAQARIDAVRARDAA